MLHYSSGFLCDYPVYSILIPDPLYKPCLFVWGFFSLEGGRIFSLSKVFWNFKRCGPTVPSTWNILSIWKFMSFSSGKTLSYFCPLLCFLFSSMFIILEMNLLDESSNFPYFQCLSFCSTGVFIKLYLSFFSSGLFFPTIIKLFFVLYMFLLK